MVDETDNESRAHKLKDEGNAYFAKGNPEEAVKAYTKGLELTPESHVLFSNRAAAYLKLKNFSQAVEDATRCVEISPEWPKGYTRLAQAYYRLGDYKKCEETIDKLKELDPENRNIKALVDGCAQKKLFEKLEGKWYGRVSTELGGYVQTFDFRSESEVVVSVFGRAIVARLKLDASVQPFHLDLLVESEPGQPAAPEVKHICKIDDDDVLHLCSPYMTLPEFRPTKFEGPAYVKMNRGEAPEDDKNKSKKKEIQGLSANEKCIRFAQAVLELLPAMQNMNVENVPESEQAQLVLENVKFQTSYYEVKDLYGDEIEEMLRLYLEKTAPCPSPELETIVNEMRSKMQKVGLFPSDEQMAAILKEQGQQQATQSTPQASATTKQQTPKPAASQAPTSPVSSSIVLDGVTPGAVAEKTSDKVNKDSSNMMLAIGAVAIAAAVITILVLKKK